MNARRGGRPLVPAYLSTGGQTRPSSGVLERLSVLTGLVRPERTGGPQGPDGPTAGGCGSTSPGASSARSEAPANREAADAAEAPDVAKAPDVAEASKAPKDPYDPENFVPLPPGPRAAPAPSGPPAPAPVPVSVTPSAPVPEPAPGSPVPADLPAAQLALLTALDGGSLTVVEAAALLELPVSAVRVLAAHLIDRGLARSRPPVPYAAQPPSDLLERVADGLRALKL